jgi:hypothetical protein
VIRASLVLRPVVIVLALAVLMAAIVLFWPRPSRYCVVDGDIILPAQMCDDGARMYEAP